MFKKRWPGEKASAGPVGLLGGGGMPAATLRCRLRAFFSIPDSLPRPLFCCNAQRRPSIGRRCPISAQPCAPVAGVEERSGAGSLNAATGRASPGAPMAEAKTLSPVLTADLEQRVCAVRQRLCRLHQRGQARGARRPRPIARGPGAGVGPDCDRYGRRCSRALQGGPVPGGDWFRGPGGPGDIPGLVFFALSIWRGATALRREIFNPGDRGPVRIGSVRAAVEMLGAAMRQA